MAQRKSTEIVDPAEDPQAALWDRVVDDPTLEQIIDDVLVLKEQAKAYADARKALTTYIRGLDDLEHAVRIRCGRHVVTITKRAGGGFQVPQWESLGIGSITSLD